MSQTEMQLFPFCFSQQHLAGSLLWAFILKRSGVMLLTALCLTFVVFFLTNLYPNLEKLAKTQGNMRMTDVQVENWLYTRGYTQPLLVRYG